ncbi:hypothetical protein FOCC_FOCC009011 [Frankliniella occidentalis]|nr:hypothetical protein FOCC_FOCC009011 [Frankliniella occidentalis]
MFAVLAHELGHSLGLQHSSVEGAVMNAWYRDGLDAEHFELHEDDTFGIQQIYGPRDGRLWAKLPKYPKYPDYSPSPRPPQRPAIAPPVVPPPALPPLRPHDPAQPAKCNTDFDAAAVIRRETYFFKGKYFWRIQEQNIPEGPHLTERFWYGFDKNYTHIDAVYERIHDNNIVFFVGKKYYVYNGTNLISGYPKPLTELGLPPTLTHIDGAMVWGHNSRTYLFSGTLFWRLDEEVGKVELDYPRDMSMWRGVGYNVDAVLQKHGVTYFFKNKGYWKFDDRHMRVEQCMPKNIAASWMGCKEPEGKWSDWEENYLDILRDSKDCFYDIAVNDDDGDSAACQAINIVVFWLSLLVSFYFAF